MRHYPLLTICLLFIANVSMAADVVWFNGIDPVTYQVPKEMAPVVSVALDMFSEDLRLVTGQTPKQSAKGTIRIIQHEGGDDGFRIYVRKGHIIIEGNNPRGTAYGILELSRMAGVSPWVWWGDIVPEHRERLCLTDALGCIATQADGLHVNHILLAVSKILYVYHRLCVGSHVFACL